MTLWLRSFARVARDDVRFALRLMRRGPRFFVALLLIASVGVGGTTAMASLAQATLLRQLPFPDAERLVMVWSKRPGNDQIHASLPDALEWRQARSFERLALMHDWAFGIVVPGAGPGMAVGALVSGDYFPALGVKALQGRLLRPEDDGADQPCRAVLSEQFSRSRGLQASVVGSTIELDGSPCIVVGIAEPEFQFGYPRSHVMDLWATLHVLWPEYARKARVARDEQEFYVLGKLRPGATVAGSERELTAIAERISGEHPGHELGVRVAALHDDAVSEVRPRIWALFVAIAAVFLAACSNIAGLFLVRAQARRAELSLRSAFGATRARLARQLITELALVFVIAAPGGWFVARLFLVIFGAITGSRWLVPPATVNDQVFLFSLVLSCVSGLAFGLGPALTLSQQSIVSGLVEAGTGSQGSRHQQRLRAALVSAQIAAACALTAISSTAFRAAAELLRTPGGFDDAGLVSIQVSAPTGRYAEEQLVGMYERLFQELRKRPGVLSATACSGVPLRSLRFEANVGRPRVEPGPPRLPSRATANLTPPGFFDMLRIPLLAGRDFLPEDTRPGARRVTIINETLRGHFFPNEDPIGQLLQHDFMDNSAPAEVIGVVGDVRRFGLQVAPVSEIYMPFGQLYVRSMEIVVRTLPEQTEAVARQLKTWIGEIEPQLPAFAGRGLTGGFVNTVGRELVLSALISVFAAVCLLLVGLGTYATVSYAAAQRTREYGIRAALGAAPRNIVGHVLAAALRWVAYGLALALCAVLALGRFLSQQIAGAPAFELSSFLLAAGGVALIALAACAGPALRAVRVPPATALRRE